MNIQVHTWIYGTLEFTFGMIYQSIWDSGMKTKYQALGYIHGLMEECTKENGRKTSSMASDSCANEYSFLWV